MKANLETRDLLLFLILVMLIINTLSNLRLRHVEAETFELDKCITVVPGDKPAAYLHVVAH